MSTKPRRLPIRWIVVSIILVALAVLPIGLKLWINAIEARRWEDMQRQLAELAQQARGRETRRSVLRGSPQPGNAWDDYEEARGAVTKDFTGELAHDYLYGRPKADRTKLRAVVEKNRPALLALRRGASKEIVMRPIAKEEVFPHHINTQHPLINLAACQARFHLEDGQAGEAARVLLDAIQYGGDGIRNGSCVDSIMSAGTVIVLEELKNLILSAKLHREELNEIARDLEVLDGDYPREADVFPNYALETGLSFLRSGDLKAYVALAESLVGIEPVVKVSTWRFGFSGRLVMVDAFEIHLSLMVRLSATAEKPWREARGVREAVSRELGDSRNPLLRFLHTRQLDLSEWLVRDRVRERRSQLRLLRAAVSYLISGEIPRLKDPFGEDLRSSVVGKRLKVWSVGPDGVDDGGLGEGWNPLKGKDIVLEVER